MGGGSACKLLSRYQLVVLLALLVDVFGWADKIFLSLFHQFLPKRCVTSAILTSLNTLKKVFLRKVAIRDACCPWHSICFSLFTVKSSHIIRKARRNSQELGNRMAKDLRLKREKNWVKLQKFLRKKRRSSKQNIDWCTMWK